MSLLETLHKQPYKKRQLIIAGIAGFLLLVIILIGLFVYEAPYKKSVRREYSLHQKSFFQIMFSKARQNAESFSRPVGEYFTQQNEDFSSQK